MRTINLKLLANEARILKKSGTLINVAIDEHVLHLKQQCLVSYEELIDWCDEKMIGASHISLFMRYFRDLTEENGCSNTYGFLCPETLSRLAGVDNDDVRSDYIANDISCTVCGKCRKLVFASYHEGLHWMLAAISKIKYIGVIHLVLRSLIHFLKKHLPLPYAADS